MESKSVIIDILCHFTAPCSKCAVLTARKWQYWQNGRRAIWLPPSEVFSQFWREDPWVSELLSGEVKLWTVGWRMKKMKNDRKPTPCIQPTKDQNNRGKSVKAKLIAAYGIWMKSHIYTITECTGKINVTDAFCRYFFTFCAPHR